VEHAFIDRGEFTLAPEFAHDKINARVYEEKTDQHKEKRMVAKLLREVKPIHPRAVTS